MQVKKTSKLTMWLGEDDWKEERGQEAVDRKAGHPAESSTWSNGTIGLNMEVVLQSLFGLHVT
jgi:hypothetical protein